MALGFKKGFDTFTEDKATSMDAGPDGSMVLPGSEAVCSEYQFWKQQQEKAVVLQSCLWAFWRHLI